ncbi:hypothetical protein RHS01_10169 [Rhizoctonia solani]|uniref:F-box domain-containing protein n=1 Tax=Rhizoctonia solani TaxID=456999 RepID=A0A8H7I2C4_9AGAM|nr:hypothetical protein RHS01_10169 [Rhizoctonia solani]
MNTSTVARRENSNHAQGGLGSLVALPVEVLIKIVTYLQPAELMTLARLSKQLRTMLMDLNSRFIWQKVISNFPGLPPCPRDVIMQHVFHRADGSIYHGPAMPYLRRHGVSNSTHVFGTRNNDELEWYTHSACKTMRTLVTDANRSSHCRRTKLCRNPTQALIKPQRLLDATLQEHREMAQSLHPNVPEVMHLRDGVMAYAACGESGNWVRRDGIVLSPIAMSIGG